MKTHQLSKHPLYNLWNSIKGRCCFKSSTSYKHYGEKGIIMCDEWKNSFLSFYEWALSNGWQKGLSIERSVNENGYNPKNCVFIKLSLQNKNRGNSRIFEYNGISKILSDWCIEFNMPYETIRHRLKKGWNFEKSITTPLLRIHNQNK